MLSGKSPLVSLIVFPVIDASLATDLHGDLVVVECVAADHGPRPRRRTKGRRRRSPPADCPGVRGPRVAVTRDRVAADGARRVEAHLDAPFWATSPVDDVVMVLSVIVQVEPVSMHFTPFLP